MLARLEEQGQAQEMQVLRFDRSGMGIRRNGVKHMEWKTKKEKYALRQNDVEAMFVSTADEGAVYSLCQFAKVVV